MAGSPRCTSGAPPWGCIVHRAYCIVHRASCIVRVVNATDSAKCCTHTRTRVQPCCTLWTRFLILLFVFNVLEVHDEVLLEPHDQGLHTDEREGNIFRVGIFLDFAGSSTRTMHPHGAYVQMRGRNRIDPHWGEGERQRMRTSFCEGMFRRILDLTRLLTQTNGSIFRAGIVR